MEKVDLKPLLYGLDLEEIQAWSKKQELPAYRAEQIAEWVYKKHIFSAAEAKNLPKDIQRALEKDFEISGLEQVEVSESSNHESTKFLFRTRDKQLIESVLISQQGRRTICLSTQVGCKMGCVFCASGKGKFGRNLEP